MAKKNTLYSDIAVIPKDNVRVDIPMGPERINLTPEQINAIKLKRIEERDSINKGTLVDLGGKPSKDTRTHAQRNVDYFDPIKGAVERGKSEWRNDKHVAQALAKTVGASAALAAGAAYTSPVVTTWAGLGQNIVAGAVGTIGYAGLEGRTPTKDEYIIGAGMEMGMPLALKGASSLYGKMFNNKEISPIVESVNNSFKPKNNSYQTVESLTDKNISYQPSINESNSIYNFNESLKRNTSIKSKTKQNIIDNIPYEDKIKMSQEEGDLIRRTGQTNGIVFENGKMYKLNSGTSKQSLHFTGSGKPVISHASGSWDSAGTTHILPYKDFGSLNGMPRATALNDTYWWNPRQFEYPKTMKTLTGDLELYSNLKNNGYPVEFNKELYAIQREIKQIKKDYGHLADIEKFGGKPKMKVGINIDKMTDNPRYIKLVNRNAEIHNEWIQKQNPKPINNLSKNINLGSLEIKHKGDPSNIRSARSNNDTPYIHSETREIMDHSNDPNKRLPKLDYDINNYEYKSEINNEVTYNYNHKWDIENKKQYEHGIKSNDYELSHVDKIQSVRDISNTKKDILEKYYTSIKDKPIKSNKELFEENILSKFLKTGKIDYRYVTAGTVATGYKAIADKNKKQ